MLRKTFIRLVMIMAVATTSLVVFAAWQNSQTSSTESCESKKDEESKPKKNEFLILESIGRTLMSTANY